MASEKATAVSSPSIEKDRISIARSEDVDARADHVDFGGESSLPPPPTLTAEEEAKLWHKIDRRLMPILCLMYLFSFLDRGTQNLSLPCPLFTVLY